VDIDLETEPLGKGSDGSDVYLKDIWPTSAEIQQLIGSSVRPEMFKNRYANVIEGNPLWNDIPVTGGQLYQWDEQSTYIHEPPYFEGLKPQPDPVAEIRGARVLALLGDSVTTDHISPAGAIAIDGAAGQFLLGRDVSQNQFNSFGSRRGNDRVMTRGTFANIRIKNLLTPGTEGSWTRHLPSGEKMSIYDAAKRYEAEGVPLIVIGGKEYGTGSSRDWAAKGTRLLGVRAVIAESFERIHRSNLVGMGVLPLQFMPGDDVASLGLSGRESFSVSGLAGELRPRQTAAVVARSEDGSERSFEAIVRLDGSIEVDYYRNGGILHTVLREMARG